MNLTAMDNMDNSISAGRGWQIEAKSTESQFYCYRALFLLPNIISSQRQCESDSDCIQQRKASEREEHKQYECYTPLLQQHEHLVAVQTSENETQNPLLFVGELRELIHGLSLSNFAVREWIWSPLRVWVLFLVVNVELFMRCTLLFLHTEDNSKVNYSPTVGASMFTSHRCIPSI